VFERLEIFQMAYGLARHAAARQAIVARNVANADTPGYRARDLASFSETYARPAREVMLRTSRPGHLVAPDGVGPAAGARLTDDPVSPNGNSVSLESEMVRAAEIRRQHELALSVYSTSLNILRSSLGRK